MVAHAPPEDAMTDAYQGPILLVLPEAADDFAATMLERMDHPVRTCHGPGAAEDCPLLHDEACPWYDEAHGIVFALDLTAPAHREILHEYQRHAADHGRDLPIRVVVPPGSPPLAELLDEVETWEHEPTIAELDGFACEVEAVDRFA
jgi:nucleotide-binding universal stress UspA family protein